MDTNALKKFAQAARNLLIDQVTARLDMVLAEGAAARREHPKAIAKLEAATSSNRQQVIEQAAYTWFNRFTALRFMDATGLTNPRVVSPADGATRPEILAEAMAGNLPDLGRPEIAEYLNGTRPAHDGQAEAYRLLVIHACNGWHGAMPYMFERADMLDRAEDFTELLMPDDLLSPDSILARLREVMTEEACKDVEIIGWLYQFYISEKKDQVFAGLKKNQKITAENIPAATQLFTPHWIVRYLVENSLGRLWLLNRPGSKLAERMDYYIAPEEPETDFLKIGKPEEIKVCDPACGSGHMLTYAFDLLYAIYEEEGYEADKIPALILQHNLTGVEIDDRAGALAAFALAMKAAAKLGRRRFLRMEARPGICVLQDVRFKDDEIPTYISKIGRDLFTDGLIETMKQFDQAKNFGSLIVPKLKSVEEIRKRIAGADLQGNLFIRDVNERVQKVLEMAEALSPRYHVVVANPPYMGSGSMDQKLKSWAQSRYASSKSDFFAMFMVRAGNLVVQYGWNALVTMEAWMFLTSYSKLRSELMAKSTIQSLLHLPYEGRSPTAMGIAFGVVAFITRSGSNKGDRGVYSRLRYFELNRDGTPQDVASIRSNSVEKPQRAFKKIPGQTIAFDASDRLIELFGLTRTSDSFASGGRCKTSNDELYLRRSWEISANSVGMKNDWCLLSKGGEFRKYFGNVDTVMRWTADAKKAYSSSGGLTKPEFWDKSGITWTIVSSKGAYSFRLKDGGTQYNSVSPTIFGPDQKIALSYLNSKVACAALKVIAPTLAANVGEVLNLPFQNPSNEPLKGNADRLVTLARSDWDAYETSWDFNTLPLLSPTHRAGTLAATYDRLRAHWQGVTDEMLRLEEENNRIFIDAYGLQDELTPEVPIEEITLTCNPAYRYGVKGTEDDRETRLRADTLAEFLSYAVGCMFGRYSLDSSGLILANQGETLADYLGRVPEPSFMPDGDNVIPVLDADWFADDIVTRTRDFLRVTFGEAKFRENLTFIEKALGKDLRKWFTKDFFDYHVRRYKKRPIYWMFSSPKGSFNALIYMHRYRPDTVSVVLNQYLREFIQKLEVERARLEKLAVDPAATPAQQTKAQKDVGAVIKQIAELIEWERDVVYPMAQQKIAIDLDDGVKRNYSLFIGALKPIKGLEAADD